MGLGLAVGAVGCGPPAAQESARPLPQATTAPSSSPSSSSSPPPAAASPLPSVAGTTPTAALPPIRRWQPNAGDVQPQAKLRAVRLIEAIGSWTAEAGKASAAKRVSAIGENPRLITQAAALLGDADQAAIEIVDAQYGGILTDAASVLVVCRQWRVKGPSVVSGGTTVDVRLTWGARGWRVIALHPADPGRPTPHPSAPASAVLASGRIDLPPAAAADVASGLVHPVVLNALLHLAHTYRIGVSVVRSGHPIHVFGTSRLSDHPRGRAFDTWRIDGRAVVDRATPKGLVTAFMHDAATAGSYNVGGPYLLGGIGNQYFSDATHHDHVHAGFVG